MTRPPLVAKAARRDDGLIVLRSPEVGLWREAPSPGSLVRPGAGIGRIEILGQLAPIAAPDDAFGIVVAQGGEEGRARRAVGFGDMLLVLDPSGASASGVAPKQSEASAAGGLVFAASSSGRFYRRPGPSKPAFVEVGDVIDKGHTVAILEIMKTFHRVSYEGVNLPDRAKVVRIVPADGDDLGPGDAILELEPAP